MSEEQKFKQFVFDTRQRAEAQISSNKNQVLIDVLKDLIICIQGLEKKVFDAGAGDADMALIKRRYEQLKKDMIKWELREEKIKDKVLPVIETEISNISKLANALPLLIKNQPDKVEVSVKVISDSAAKIAAALTPLQELNKPQE